MIMSKSNVSLTKKKFYGIIDIHKKCLNSSVDNFEKELMEYLNYDPLKSSYNQEYGKRLMEQRKRHAEGKGKSLYELYHKPYIKKKNDNNVKV